MFTDVNSQVVAKSRVVTSSNSTADIEVYIEDLGRLVGGEYSLQFTDGNYYITRPNGQQSIVPIIGNSIAIDGIRIDIKNGLQTGERVLIRPTRNAAAQIQMETNDPSEIAAQSYEASTTFAQGSAEFFIVNAGDLREFEVIISPNGQQFAVTDTDGNILLAPQPYPPSGPVTVLGTSFAITPGALPNDKFTANLVPSEGDNGNLLNMQDIQTKKHLNDGESTVLDLYHNLNTDVGLRMSTASRLTDVSRLEKETAQERIATISGVNLDEEAANMMKFQQIYMASSRIMQASNDTFNAILALR